jgi:hypothetical protein
MAVNGLQPIHVTNHQIVAVPFFFELFYPYFSVKCRVNGVACLRFQIDAVMIAPASPSPEIRCHMSIGRHGEVLQIHDKSIGSIF